MLAYGIGACEGLTVCGKRLNLQSLGFKFGLWPKQQSLGSRSPWNNFDPILRARTCIALLETRPRTEIVQQLPIVPLRIGRLDKLGITSQDEDINSSIFYRVVWLVRAKWMHRQIYSLSTRSSQLTSLGECN